MSQLGTDERPLRVAIVGAGPSGFYAAGAMLKAKLTLTIDIFDRLPAPHGLVRYGVAPDHQNIKAVSKVYDRTLNDERVRFFGNVDFGTDISHDEMCEHYDQIIYAVGAQSDRNLDIPGEALRNSMSATEFVAWYNGHPDYVDLDVDLSVSAAVVVGVGNVAMDVARILAKSVDELKETDIADHALQKLEQSQIKDIYVLARRGPAQVKFTSPEIREFGHLDVAHPVVYEQELKLDQHSRQAVAEDSGMQKNYDWLTSYAEMNWPTRDRRVHFLFLRSPVEILDDGSGGIAGVRIEKNRLEPTESGYLNAVGTGEFETLTAGLVLRSIGYRGVPLDGVPFNERRGTIPHREGRIVDAEDNVVAGEYVVGWAKRGPSGVIGTNKPDSIETAEHALADVPSLDSAPKPDPQAMIDLLQSRDVQLVRFEDWQMLDEAEQAAGEEQGRPRVKFVNVDEMLAHIEAAKQPA